jgi:hypothetical protein
VVIRKGSADGEYFFGAKKKPSLLSDGFSFLAPVRWRLKLTASNS